MNYANSDRVRCSGRTERVMCYCNGGLEGYGGWTAVYLDRPRRNYNGYRCYVCLDWDSPRRKSYDRVNPSSELGKRVSYRSLPAQMRAAVRNG
jgi:hypothetical protein